MTPCISSYTESTAKQYNMVTPSLTHIMVRYTYLVFFDTYLLQCVIFAFFHQVEQTNEIYLSTQRFMSNMTLPCEWIKSVDNQNENFCAVPLDNSDRSFTNESKSFESDTDLIWKEIQLFGDNVSEIRTWESLGAPEFSKQLLFVTDLPETALHLARIRQTSILSLLPKKVKMRQCLRKCIMQKLFSLCYRQCIPYP